MIDVLIAGGGLAGLTLSLQLKTAMPGLAIRVIERRTHPVPAATHKVGESTVEIGAHYFAEVLGLREHLDREQLRKFGFRFFFSEGEPRLQDTLELGASRVLPTPAWQIDRGVFENFLAEEAQRRGVAFDDGTSVRDVALDASGGHCVQVEREGARETLQARWIVDASGRAGLLKRKLDLAEDNGHSINAVWFRLRNRFNVDDWTNDAEWRARCNPPARWRSTNHLCGAGYWLWLIPLSSGAHSVGIVADPRAHALEAMDTPERALSWIERYQPSVHQHLKGVLRTDGAALMDFRYLRGFSYGCRQVLSSERWALTGEAGRFLDPFYSPGSDFIAIGNTYITELIRLDRSGEPLRAPALLFEEVFGQFYDSMLTLYRDQYPLFGNGRVMSFKVLWDYTYYWGVLCPLFFGGHLTDLATMGTLAPLLTRASSLNGSMQGLLRDWGNATLAAAAPQWKRGLVDQAALPWFAELNRALTDRTSAGESRQRIGRNVALLEDIAGELAQLAMSDCEGLETQVPLTDANIRRRGARLLQGFSPSTQHRTRTQTFSEST